MDSTVKQMLDGFRFAVGNYTSSLGPDNEKLKRTKELIDSLYSKAEDGADVSAITMDPDFAEAGGLLGALASELPLPQDEQQSVSAGAGESDSGIPSAGVVAAGYHMAYDSMGAPARESQGIYYERIFEIEKLAENAVHFNTLLVEDGVLLDMSRIPLIESAEETLKQAETIFSPTVDLQQKLAVETYADVKTVAELEFQGTLMAELSNVEHVWDALFIETLVLLPGCAQAIEAFGATDDNVAKLRNSHLFMADFLGITWAEVFADPRFLLFWNNIFWPRVPSAKRELYKVYSAEGWRDLLKGKFYDPYVKDLPIPQPDPDKAFLRFWGDDHPVHDTLQLLRTPPRPDIRKDSPN
ncbi:MAG: hypothetical protein KAH54_09015 [Candidatus Sabulitectum sp.]|nr:hypothetical protein [Candidatus Sabulitectum sp.]